MPSTVLALPGYHADFCILVLARVLEARARDERKVMLELWKQLVERVQRDEDAVQSVFDVFEFITHPGAARDQVATRGQMRKLKWATQEDTGNQKDGDRWARRIPRPYDLPEQSPTSFRRIIWANGGTEGGMGGAGSHAGGARLFGVQVPGCRQGERAGQHGTSGRAPEQMLEENEAFSLWRDGLGRTMKLPRATPRCLCPRHSGANDGRLAQDQALVRVLGGQVRCGLAGHGSATSAEDRVVCVDDPGEDSMSPGTPGGRVSVHGLL